MHKYYALVLISFLRFMCCWTDNSTFKMEGVRVLSDSDYPTEVTSREDRQKVLKVAFIG